MKSKFPVLVLVLIIAVGTFSLSALSGTSLGLSLEEDYTNETTYYGGYLSTGGLLKVELGGLEPAGENSSEINLFSYLLGDLTLGDFGSGGSLHLYLGASPAMSLDTNGPSFSFSSSSAYGKIGLQFNLFPFSVRAQTTGELDFEGNLKSVLGGVGFGLTF
ncbi:MAG: hypothetical protein ACLFO4_01265 [Candidatus Acetothermia bacterium]